MTSFCPLKISNIKEDTSSQWTNLIGLLSVRSRAPVKHSVTGSSANSFVSSLPSRERHLSLRRLASDSHLSDQHSIPSPQASFVSQNRTPSVASEAQQSYHLASMAGMKEIDRSRCRRDRTFVGSQCAVCEEPLEHTLRGERILQFSCSHVSHEACFYEYIKEVDAQYCPECNSPLGLDSSRGGNVLDLGKSTVKLSGRY